MEYEDEYDAYNVVLDIEDMPYLTDVAFAPQPSQVPPLESPQQVNPSREQADLSPGSIKSGSSDTYSDYDFSEFTEQDFAFIDASISASLHSSPPKLPPISEPGTPESQKAPLEAGADGPAVVISIEEGAEVGAADTDDSFEQLSAKRTRSPYESFRRWNGTLAVTDLSGPAWCEVQFDYGLRQKRSRKLELRPASFISSGGKVISVNRDVAAVNDRITKRGKSVHKVLEWEIHAEQKPVEVTIPEERWALRLVNMIGCVDTILQLGRCREMPVFGVLHDQVIIGIIDEVERKPIPEPLGITTKRLPGKRSVPTTPTKLQTKRSRLSVSPKRPPITSFFHSPLERLKEVPGDKAPVPDIREEQIRPTTPIAEPTPPSEPPHPKFRLHLSDTKTRKHHTLPLEEDTLPAKLQLMLYHRLLSNLLIGGVPWPNPRLDFGQLWGRLGLDRTRVLSKGFLIQAGLVPPEGDISEETLKCLDDLVEAWRIAVELLNIDGIDDSLTVVYRTQPQGTLPKKSGNSKAFPSLAQREADDLARAVMASLEDTSADQDEELARAIEESLKHVTSTNNTFPDSLGGPLPSKGDQEADIRAPTTTEGGPDVELAIHQPPREEVNGQPKDEGTSGPQSETRGPPQGFEKDGESTDAEDSDEPEGEGSVIIGKKVFNLDNNLLDEHLTDVLDWWYGRRPPRGVDIQLTRRCMWCEYREGCEWREQKASEALSKVNGKRRDNGRP